MTAEKVDQQHSRYKYSLLNLNGKNLIVLAWAVLHPKQWGQVTVGLPSVNLKMYFELALFIQ